MKHGKHEEKHPKEIIVDLPSPSDMIRKSLVVFGQEKLIRCIECSYSSNQRSDYAGYTPRSSDVATILAATS